MFAIFACTANIYTHEFISQRMLQKGRKNLSKDPSAKVYNVRDPRNNIVPAIR